MPPAIKCGVPPATARKLGRRGLRQTRTERRARVRAQAPQCLRGLRSACAYFNSEESLRAAAAGTARSQSIAGRDSHIFVTPFLERWRRSLSARVAQFGLCDGLSAPIISGVSGKALPMSISISNSPSPASIAAVNSHSDSAQAPRTQPATNNSDTVTLSQAQQVTQLYQQGQQVPQIASTLSLPVDIVNSYLGITSQ